jgi:hypothetical protein
MMRLPLAAMALALSATMALAQATTVDIPVGSWLAGSAAFLQDILPVLIPAVLAWVFRFLPASIVGLLRTAQVEQLLQKAIDYGFNAIPGADKEKPLTVDIGNAVVAQIVGYAIKYGPGWVINWLGGVDGIRARVIARLGIAANVGVTASGLLYQPGGPGAP